MLLRRAEPARGQAVAVARPPSEHVAVPAVPGYAPHHALPLAVEPARPPFSLVRVRRLQDPVAHIPPSPPCPGHGPSAPHRLDHSPLPLLSRDLVSPSDNPCFLS